MDQRPQYQSEHTEPDRRERGSTLQQMGTGDRFLSITPAAHPSRATLNKWDIQRLRSFCKAKDTVTKTKRQPTD